MMKQINKDFLSIGAAIYRCSARAVVIKDHKLLTVIEPEGWLGLPGGGIEYDETIADALYREIYEELGISRDNVNIGKILFINNFAVHNGIPRFNIFYEVGLDFKNVKSNPELIYKWSDKNILISENLAPGLKVVKNKILNLL